MGLFGDVDAEEVSDNPFYVAPDTYKCVLSEANRVAKKSGDGEGLSFKWVILDEESDFYQNSISDWKNIYPDITSEDVTPDIKKDMARLKGRLKEMGLTAEQMDTLLDDDNLDLLVGTEAYVKVTESKDKDDPEKVYSNVASVSLIGEDD